MHCAFYLFTKLTTLIFEGTLSLLNISLQALINISEETANKAKFSTSR